MQKNDVSTIKDSILYEWRLAFFSTVIIGLLTHLYIFLHRLPNPDGLLNIYSSQAKETSGRFFLSIASGFSTYFDLPWVIGLLSILFLALTSVCVVILFEVKKKIAVILISGIIVTFPSVSATFSYLFTADGYMLGTFFSILAILFTKKYRFGFILGSLLLCLAVGIYQANLSITLAFITLWLIQDILLRKTNTIELWMNIIRSGLMVGIGMVAYLAIYKIYTGHLGVSITSYQGLDKVGSVTLGDFPKVFRKIAQELKTFFFDGFFNKTDVNFLEWLNVFVIITLIIASITILVKNKVYKNIAQLVVLVLLVMSLPISFYIVYFLSIEATYHMLMVFSICVVYIYLILLYDTIDLRNTILIEHVTSWAIVVLLSLTIYNFGLIANIAYFNMELKYERSIFLANRILDRVEQLENYNEIEKIHVVGRYQMETDLSSHIIPRKIPSMVGSKGEHILIDTAHFKRMFENFLGYRLDFLTPKEVEQLNGLDEIKEIGIWPSQDSIRVIGDVLVIKLAE